jgi:hypothetical protein
MSNPYEPPRSSPGFSPSLPPGASPRPTAATVFGVLNMVFAALGLCGLLMSAAVWTFTIVSLGLGFVATIVLAISGIGLLQLRPWGRYLAIGYSLFAIIQAVVGTIVNWVFLVAPMMERAGEAGVQGQAAMGAAIGGVLGGCIGLIYPVLLLIFMYRPNMIAAFHPQQASKLSY